MTKLFENISGLLWGPATVAIVLISGAYLLAASGFYPVRKLGFILKSTFGDMKSGGFAATATALGATVGTGNIVGVASAIAVGGAGAVFWMWVGAFFGMMLKFAESSLAVKYHGGAMIYMERAFGGRGISLLWSVFCVLASFGTGNMTQTNAAGAVCERAFGTDPVTVGIIIAVLAFAVLFGGSELVTKASGVIVPLMAAVYVLGAGALLFLCRENIFPAFSSIFEGAFEKNSALGGTVGLLSSKAVKTGLARGTFTNEAGMGSASIAHAESKNTLPEVQGCWGVIEVFLDTVFCCTVTALVILSSGFTEFSEDSVSAAFEKYFGGIGGGILAVSMVLFALAAVIGWAFYGEKALYYITNSKKSTIIYRVTFCVCAVIGSAMSVPLAWSVADIFNALMLFPNILALFALRKEIISFTK